MLTVNIHATRYQNIAIKVQTLSGVRAAEDEVISLDFNSTSSGQTASIFLSPANALAVVTALSSHLGILIEGEVAIEARRNKEALLEIARFIPHEIVEEL